MPHNSLKHGFTLIELSIVLIIIGLIVSGILFGKDLIHAAELRAQITQIEQFTTAYWTYKGKYGSAPGDNPKATDFFGGATLDGDGNGYIQNYVTDTADNGFDYEQAEFFVQLSLGHLIPGEFTNEFALHAGIPEAKIAPGKGFMAASSMYSIACDSYNQASDCVGRGEWKVGYFFNLGDMSQTSPIDADEAGVFTPLDTYTIDLKMDDGLAHTGRLRAATAINDGYYSASPTPCMTGPSAPATYDLSNLQPVCQFGYKVE
jgi:prepilin-type N-terminal cleavage/methylation domain-containing protein